MTLLLLLLLPNLLQRRGRSLDWCPWLGGAEGDPSLRRGPTWPVHLPQLPEHAARLQEAGVLGEAGVPPPQRGLQGSEFAWGRPTGHHILGLQLCVLGTTEGGDFI